MPVLIMSTVQYGTVRRQLHRTQYSTVLIDEYSTVQRYVPYYWPLCRGTIREEAGSEFETAAKVEDDTVDAPDAIVGNDNSGGAEAKDERVTSMTEGNDNAPSRGIRFTFEFRLWF